MFQMHRSHPSVERLQLHLTDQQAITFSGSADIDVTLAKSGSLETRRVLFERV